MPAKLIEFYIPRKYKPRKWIPPSQCGKLLPWREVRGPAEPPVRMKYANPEK